MKKIEEKEQWKLERLIKKQLREEELKCKREEKARKAELREAKRLVKQTKQPQQREQRRDTVDNEAEENVPTPLSSGEQTSKDIAGDNNSSEGNAGRSTTKTKPSSQIESVAKRSRH